MREVRASLLLKTVNRMRMGVRLSRPIALGLLLATLSSCSHGDAASKTSQTNTKSSRAPDARAIPVETAPVEVKTMPVTIGAVGTVEAISTVDIRALVTGQLQAINFTPGEDVRKGQPLFTIDPRPFEAALSQAQAALARDTAQADDAKLQRDRFETLFNRGLIPRDQYDTQTASVTAFDATLASDRAQVEQAQLNLQYTNITAPINGRSGALLVHAGDLIRANDTDPMVTLKQLAPIDVTFAVPGRLLVDIQRFNGQSPLTVTATSQASTAPSVQPQGKVTFIDNAVDPTTATIKLKATFANNDRRLWPGLFVQVALQLSSQSNALVVPAIAVQPSQQGQYVYVVKPDRTVEMRTVTVDRQQGDQAIIGAGLRSGEEVVTVGQLRLTPGAHVSVSTGGDEGPTS